MGDAFEVAGRTAPSPHPAKGPIATEQAGAFGVVERCQLARQRRPIGGPRELLLQAPPGRSVQAGALAERGELAPAGRLRQRAIELAGVAGQSTIRELEEL